MIPVCRDEIPSRFAGIPVVFYTLISILRVHLKNFIPANWDEIERQDPSFVLPGPRRMFSMIIFPIIFRDNIQNSRAILE